MKFKFFISTIFFILSLCIAKAGEGMWMPNLLKLLNEKDMKDAGLKISVDEIYSTNKSSLKDAICLFGGGCTAEVISDKGLILTNHHCGFDAVQQLSSITNDYIKNGYWAKNLAEEKPCAGLTVTFIVDIKEVTNEILIGVRDSTAEKVRMDLIKKNIENCESKAIAEFKLGAQVKSFFGGNKYYLFITETFKDIRLVGVPPSSIGKFGADGDNWMWPRHTGDFSIFRIYTNKDNKSSEYSSNNIPYTPKKSLTINLKDVKENDFTMVYGFPARTTEYLPNQAIDITKNISDPIKVEIRTKKLAIWDAAMRVNDTTRIQYAAKYASVANGWKKWQGEMKGLERLDAIEKRKNQEQEIRNIESKTLDNNKTDMIFKRLESVYGNYRKYLKMRDLYSEAGLGVELISFCNSINNVLTKMSDTKLSQDEKLKESTKIINASKKFYKDFDSNIDAKVFDNIFYHLNDSIFDTGLSVEIKKLFNNNFPTSKDVFKQSVFINKKLAVPLLDSNLYKIDIIKSDIAFKLTKTLVDYYNKNISQQILSIENELNELNRAYIKIVIDAFKNKKFYPDANSTLRIAYGNVKPYNPRDGVKYNWYTTYKGILEKEDANNDDYTIHPQLKKLFLDKNFGKYADKNNDLRIAFIASNHTTGGNSGSPVLNAKGELIGTNFDRCWEGTMSDIMYDPEQCRNITLDIHYTLFVIDKFAGAGYLLNEMKIIN
jgi:hypothetical protein